MKKPIEEFVAENDSPESEETYLCGGLFSRYGSLNLGDKRTVDLRLEKLTQLHSCWLESYLRKNRGSVPSRIVGDEDLVGIILLGVAMCQPDQPLPGPTAIKSRARYLLKDVLRMHNARSGPRRASLDESADDSPAAKHILAANVLRVDRPSREREIERLADEGIALLPPAQRYALMLRNFAGLTNDKAAAEAGVSKQTMTRNYSDALSALDIYLRERGVGKSDIDRR